jgi:uracil-DNA glycosylase
VPYGLQIRAVAVDNEPEPFWNGTDEAERITAWRDSVGFDDRWGVVTPCGHLNGSSGNWVDEMILSPLGTTRQDTWITDCVDTYFESADAAARLDASEMVDLLMQLGIVARQHRPHPNESAIVRDAISAHSERLLTELYTARPDCVVTLGNAALRVLGKLADVPNTAPRKLSAQGTDYGRSLTIRVHGRAIQWLPLAHPAAPQAYQVAHRAWVSSRPATGCT